MNLTTVEQNCATQTATLSFDCGRRKIVKTYTNCSSPLRKKKRKSEKETAKLLFAERGNYRKSRGRRKTRFIFILTKTLRGASVSAVRESRRLFHPSFHFLRGHFVPPEVDRRFPLPPPRPPPPDLLRKRQDTVELVKKKEKKEKK